MKLFEKIFETLGWIKIFLSPFLLGLVIGGSFVLFTDHTLFKLVGILIFIGGIFAGVFLANSALDAGGTQKTLSRLQQTPDWDDLTRDMRKKEQADQKQNDGLDDGYNR